MRTIRSLNEKWRYRPVEQNVEQWDEVSLPHANKEIPLDYFDEKEYQFVSIYERTVDCPELCADWKDGRVFVDFEGVMCRSEVSVNGTKIATHNGGYTPFSVELTEHLPPSGRITLTVLVDSTEREDTPPFGGVVDYLCFGGIYREVNIRFQSRAFIRDVHLRPGKVLEAYKSLLAEVEIDTCADDGSFQTELILLDGEKVIGSSKAQAERIPDQPNLLRAILSLEGLSGIELWDTERPKLYTAHVTLVAGGTAHDTVENKTGFRDARWESDGFYLNGNRLPLTGLNRHQSWPYAGYAMPRRAQRRDAEILKNELSVNIVRTSHYPQSRHFLDACDELGLLVFEEIPGWQHIGGDDWKNTSLLSLREMIVRDRNRPSVVLWGVRINESGDDDAFYERTNALARELDPDRSTGGVRYIKKSNFLEDVYTFNDFTHEGGKRVLCEKRKVTGKAGNVPYLVTEHSGHMFPTKRFDNEERLMEHAMRHARVIEASRAYKGIAGAIGWCAFDYNTHKDFGSGDRICHHGVSDIFRSPKYAAAVYSSQRKPEKGVVLEAASIFAKGERSGARMTPVAVFTNCDYVELWRGEKRIGRYYPDIANFPHLEHPPIMIEELIGDQLEAEPFKPADRKRIKALALRVLAKGADNIGIFAKLSLLRILLRYRMSFAQAASMIGRYAYGWGTKDERVLIAGFKGGVEVARKIYGSDARATALVLRADDTSLFAGQGAGARPENTWDTTRITVRLEDQYGNPCPFTPEAAALSIDGPVSVVGPKSFALHGGQAAFWIRTEGKTGIISISARTERFKSNTITIQVE